MKGVKGLKDFLPKVLKRESTFDVRLVFTKNSKCPSHPSPLHNRPHPFTPTSILPYKYRMKYKKGEADVGETSCEGLVKDCEGCEGVGGLFCQKFLKGNQQPMFI